MEIAETDTAISRLQQHVVELAEQDMDQYYLGHETYISDKTTLYARTRGYQQTTYHGQVCCVTPEQSTVSVELHPEDFQTVVQAGWVVPQLQSSKSWLSTSPRSSTATKTMVFAPRHEGELEVVKDIISAAAWWVKGVDSRDASMSWT
jgi:NOL1/NOP2/fmu family ribosome biogenesis protein